MGVSQLSVSVDDGGKLGRLSAALGEADASIPGDIQKVLFEAAQRLAQTAREKVQAEPTHGPKHTGLRATIAAGVAVKPTAGGAEITTSMPQADEAVIPRGTDEPAQGWKHPVFGHRNNWVRQHDAFSWFMDTMAEGKDSVTDDVSNVLERAAEKIAAA